MAVDMDTELLDVFRDEATDTLDALALCLESLRDPATEHATTLEAAFRHAHNLKGAARVVGYDAVVTITHTMEDMLSGFRESGGVPGDALVDTMLQALTVIERAVDGSDQATAAEAVVARMAAGVESSQDHCPAAAADDDAARLTPSAARAPEQDDDGDVLAPAGADGVRNRAPARSPAPRRAADPSAAPGSVRVDVVRLDRLMGYTAELLVTHAGQATRFERLERFSDAFRQATRGLAPEYRIELDRLVRDVDELVLDTRQDVRAAGYLNEEIGRAMQRVRMLPLSGLAAQWRRTAREAAQEIGRAVSLTLDVGDIEVDKHILDALRDPIMHLLRNAVGHGIEDAHVRAEAGKPPVGQVALRARMHGARVAITVTDDGRGFDAAQIAATAVEKSMVAARDAARMTREEALNLMFLPGFSTAKAVSHLSGRGVGMDVVRSRVEALAGEVRIVAEGGLGGATFELLIPLSLVSDRGLLVRAGDTIGVVGVKDIERTLLAGRDEMKEIAGEQVLEVDGAEPLVVRSLASLLGERDDTGDRHTIVVVRHGRTRVGLSVSDILGEERVVTKRLPWNLAAVQGVQGGVILAGGQVALVLDAAHLVSARGAARAPRAAEPAAPPRAIRVLVVDDSVTSRTLERNILRSAGYDVLVAKDGEEGWQVLQDAQVDLVICDVEMPRCTGLELVARIRASERHGDLPVILVTSLGSEEDLSAGARAGADEYIVKGRFDQRQLLEAVARLT